MWNSKWTRILTSESRTTRMCDLPTGRPFRRKWTFQVDLRFQAGHLRLPRYDRHERFLLTDAPYNAHTIMVVAEAMARIYTRKGYGSIHLAESSAIHLGNHRPHGEDLCFPRHHGPSQCGEGHDPHLGTSFGVFTMSWTAKPISPPVTSQNFKQGFKTGR